MSHGGPALSSFLAFSSTNVFQHRDLWKITSHRLLNLNVFNCFHEYKNVGGGNEKQYLTENSIASDGMKIVAIADKCL